MTDGRLSRHERYRIHALHEAGCLLRGIAFALDRAPSIISRELRRNLVGRCYDPVQAQHVSQRYRSRASGRRRIAPMDIEHIEACLREDWSPEQVAGTTGLASHAWIYQHVYADQRRGGTLFQGLRRRRRQRRRRRLRDGRGQLRHRRSWRERPAVVEDRSRLGDWRSTRCTLRAVKPSWLR